MNSKWHIVLLIGFISLAACNRNSEKAASTSPPAAVPESSATATPPAASQPAPVASQPAPGASQPAPSASQPATTPPPADTVAEARPAPEPVKRTPPPPPPPKKYVLEAGTPITVRTLGDVSTKTSASGNEFEATLESPLTVDGHTLAKRGATVFGKVVNADKGGRVKGKASLTLALSRVHLADGQTVAISTNSVSQQAKSDTKKNLVRTGIASGVGAAIGGIAGGGKGAAIGAGIGGGAGVAANVATRGPAAEIPPETVLNFSLSREVVVVEKAR